MLRLRKFCIATSRYTIQIPVKEFQVAVSRAWVFEHISRKNQHFSDYISTNQAIDQVILSTVILFIFKNLFAFSEQSFIENIAEVTRDLRYGSAVWI